jgi:hypothetical protein
VVSLFHERNVRPVVLTDEIQSRPASSSSSALHTSAMGLDPNVNISAVAVDSSEALVPPSQSMPVRTSELTAMCEGAPPAATGAHHTVTATTAPYVGPGTFISLKLSEQFRQRQTNAVAPLSGASGLDSIMLPRLPDEGSSIDQNSINYGRQTGMSGIGGTPLSPSSPMGGLLVGGLDWQFGSIDEIVQANIGATGQTPRDPNRPTERDHIIDMPVVHALESTVSLAAMDVNVSTTLNDTADNPSEALKQRKHNQRNQYQQLGGVDDLAVTTTLTEGTLPDLGSGSLIDSRVHVFPLIGSLDAGGARQRVGSPLMGVGSSASPNTGASARPLSAGGNSRGISSTGRATSPLVSRNRNPLLHPSGGHIAGSGMIVTSGRQSPSPVSSAAATVSIRPISAAKPLTPRPTSSSSPRSKRPTSSSTPTATTNTSALAVTEMQECGDPHDPTMVAETAAPIANDIDEAIPAGTTFSALEEA